MTIPPINLYEPVPELNVYAENTRIKSKENVKYFAVLLDNKFTFHLHTRILEARWSCWRNAEITVFKKRAFMIYHALLLHHKPSKIKLSE